MHKFIKLSLILPVVLIGYAVTLKKPTHLKGNYADIQIEEIIPPVVFYTSLSDSLPAEAIDALGVGDVLGIRLKSLNGHYASYYQYEADASKVISMLSGLPFQRSAILADTICRKISFSEFEHLRTNMAVSEIQNAPDFWLVSENEVDVYQSIKPPLRHTLVIRKTNNTIYHRVDPVI